MDTISSVSYFVRTVWLTSRNDNLLRSFSFFVSLTHNFCRQLSDFLISCNCFANCTIFGEKCELAFSKTVLKIFSPQEVFSEILS